MGKRGVKNIPLPVDDEDEIKLIEAEYGLKGWATVRKLQQFIGEHGYYVKWDIDTQLLFIREKCLSAVGRSAVSEIVACALRRGVFDAAMFEKQQILTSTRLQETFLITYKRSKEIVFDKNYALPVVYDFIQNVNKSEKSVNIILKNADKAGSNSIVEDSIVSDSSSAFLLTEEEYKELCASIGKSDCDYYIERVKAFKNKHPEAKFSTKALILKMQREDKAKELSKTQNKSVKTYTTEALNAKFDSLNYEDL